MAEQDEKHRKDLEKQYENKMNTAKVIQDQLHDFKLRYVRQMQEDMLEGELIKRQVEEKMAEELRKEQERLNALKEL